MADTEDRDLLQDEIAHLLELDFPGLEVLLELNRIVGSRRKVDATIVAHGQWGEGGCPLSGEEFCGDCLARTACDHPMCE